jgi:hypothetical protein
VETRQAKAWQEAQDQAELQAAAEQYHNLLSHPGWLRLEEEVRQDAQETADEIIALRYVNGESAEEFRAYMTERQQKIAAAQFIVNIPRLAIDRAERTEK